MKGLNKLVGTILLVTLAFTPTGHLAAQEPNRIWDPLESINRPIFWFNDQLYVYLLKPVSKGYDAVAPRPVKTGITNFFEHWRYPIYFVSSLLQLKVEQAAEQSARFVINTTAGLGGLIDIAKLLDLPHHYEDLGTAFGYWGVPAGPYLVIPILGPSNFRDGIGLIGDGFLDPLAYVHYTSKVDSTDAWIFTLGTSALNLVNTINRRRDAIEAAKDSSLDYYLFIQSAYYQTRYALIHDGARPPGESEDWDEDFEDWEDIPEGNHP